MGYSSADLGLQHSRLDVVLVVESFVAALAVVAAAGIVVAEIGYYPAAQTPCPQPRLQHPTT